MHRENKKVYGYSDICYQAKGVDITKVRLLNNLMKKISIGKAERNTQEVNAGKDGKKKAHYWKDEGESEDN